MRSGFGTRYPDQDSVAPLCAVFSAVVVLAAYFHGVFVVVVLDRCGVGSVIARSRACTDDGTASISIDINPSSFSFGCMKMATAIRNSGAVATAINGAAFFKGFI